MIGEHGCDRRQLIGCLAAAGLVASLGPVYAQGNRLVITIYGGRYERF